MVNKKLNFYYNTIKLYEKLSVGSRPRISEEEEERGTGEPWTTR